MIVELIKDIRLVIADLEGNRYSDDVILRYIDMAQKTIATQTLCFRSTIPIAYKAGTLKYKLPGNVIKLISVSLDDVKYYDLDNDSIITYANNQEEIAFKSSLEQLFNLDISDVQNDLYGVLAFTTDFGTESSGLGLVSFVPSYIFMVKYYSLPSNITSINDKLELNSTYHYLIRHFVCSMLLRADADTLSRTLGNEEYTLFEKGILRLKRESVLDFSNTQYNIQYRRI